MLANAGEPAKSTRITEITKDGIAFLLWGFPIVIVVVIVIDSIDLVIAFTRALHFRFLQMTLLALVRTSAWCQHPYVTSRSRVVGTTG